MKYLDYPFFINLTVEPSKIQTQWPWLQYSIAGYDVRMNVKKYLNVRNKFLSKSLSFLFLQSYIATFVPLKHISSTNRANLIFEKKWDGKSKMGRKIENGMNQRKWDVKSELDDNFLVDFFTLNSLN